jgi:predicted nucleic acid-binding protein
MREKFSWVLDTSALFALKEEEEGAGAVEKILRSGGKSGRVFISFMTLMEFYYLILRAHKKEHADKSLLMLKQLPLRVIESDEELTLSAAQIKASTPLSVADAWIAATALSLGAILVHKDPEYEPLKNKIRQQILPYK